VQPALRQLIERFRVAQDRGVAFVADVLRQTLGVRLPRNPYDWVVHCGETGLYNVRRLNGIEVYSHGYGIELIFPDLSIDFDWGEFGEPDGFDAWRLYNFARHNPCGTRCPELAEVRAWIEEAEEAGELIQDRYLYYLLVHRVTRNQVEVSSALRTSTE